MNKKELLKVLDGLSTDDLRDYVIYGGIILDRRVDTALTAALEHGLRLFKEKAIVRKVGKSKNALQLQAMPVSIKDYMKYVQGVESVMLQLHDAQHLAFGPHPGTDGFEVTHTFTTVPKTYRFLMDADDDSFEMKEVLSIRRDLNPEV